MKAIIAATLGFAALLPAAAQAQRWEPINARQANLERRIDQGIRAGTLNRREADRLRVQFRDLDRLEQRYRRSGGGLTRAERTDLNRRYDVLSQRVRFQKQDRQQRRW
ncbi:hypothetical protein ACLN6N_09330 [Sphingomonas carotinifaciens]|uniref:Uncharacterized protein n=1 Tax=Sphingomonas carotinifaciens TaxID=1166323 RepID=A0A1G7L2V3_9SPHN|nr:MULTISPECIES: hypothetical protein [Sphingomonas]MBB4085509.1 hypothetical protein [Sphingomonas carotinifaciens]MWC43469.1 hypothetical protein [Sphingomonas carotinifaciens]SDF43775.1 hypothetical protein SAMN05216557_103357 [Sphingomonas carotinifaciens]